MPRLPVNSSDYFIFPKKKTTKCRSQLLCNLLQMWQVAQHRQQMLTNCENSFLCTYHYPFSSTQKGYFCPFLIIASNQACVFFSLQDQKCYYIAEKPKKETYLEDRGDIQLKSRNNHMEDKKVEKIHSSSPSSETVDQPWTQENKHSSKPKPTSKHHLDKAFALVGEPSTPSFTK